MVNWERKGQGIFRSLYQYLKRNPQQCGELKDDISVCTKEKADNQCNTLPITKKEKLSCKNGVEQEFRTQHMKSEPKGLIYMEGRKIRYYE